MMHIFKKLLTVLFCVLLICLLATPVGLLYVISQNEQAQYQPESVPVVEELAYGNIVSVHRRDIYETITLSGTIVSSSEFFMELCCKDPYSLRFLVSAGDVIHPGDLIAYEGEKEILSDAWGLIREINLGSDPYLRLYSLDELALECFVNETQKAVLLRSDLTLLDTDGEELCLLEMDEVYAPGNMTRVLLAYDKADLCYGQALEELVLTTGKIYAQALVVEEKCVYKKSDAEGDFLRLVDENGHYLSEIEVQTGYSNGEYICVSGVEEGTYCDSGYKTLVEDGYAGA